MPDMLETLEPLEPAGTPVMSWLAGTRLDIVSLSEDLGHWLSGSLDSGTWLGCPAMSLISCDRLSGCQIT